MKKILTILFVLAALNVVAQLSPKQILVAEDGVNALIEAEVTQHLNNKIAVELTVQWVDNKLQETTNMLSELVLKHSEFSISANQPLQSQTITVQKKIVRFHDKTTLIITYSGERLNEFTMSFTPFYARNNEVSPEPFLMAHPKKYTKTFSQLSGPKIVITEPTADKARGFMPIIDNPLMTIKGYLTSNIGLKELIINQQVVAVKENGTFDYQIRAQKGENRVTIEAIDIKNNHTLENFTFRYSPPLQERDLNDLNYHALIVGIEHYTDPDLMDLDFPIDDADTLYNILTEKYLFAPENVVYLKNATNRQLINTLDSLTRIIDEDDNFLIFYAGHGYWDEKTEIGYWLPSDAEKNSTANWFRNSTLRDYISGIQSNHTLLIADACFSGGIFKTRSAFSGASLAVEKLYNMPSRKAMTSGTLKEVPDKSVFTKYLVERLSESDKKFISASELFNSFRDAVLNNSPNIPQFGTIQNSGDEGGDFIFIKR